MNLSEVDLYLKEIKKEYEREAVDFNDFNSTHEGYAFILERVDTLWQSIKSEYHSDARKEAIQIAALILKFLVDTKDKTMAEFIAE